MMYAWNQRSDTSVVDEPMYAHYLAVTGLDHPVRAEVMASLPVDEDTVVASMLNGTWDTPIVFIKNMAHHLEGMEIGVVDRMDNFLLTRDPRDMLPSLRRGLGRTPTMRDAAYELQIEILERIIDSGREPIVVDSRSVLDAPEPVLKALCAALDIPFDSAMLSWPAGAKTVDGVWGLHWYKRLHRSTGFEPNEPSKGALADDLKPLYDECAPMYNRLSSYSIA